MGNTRISPLRRSEEGLEADPILQHRIYVFDLSQYLPILIFILIALALSAAFVFLPMLVSRLTGAHNPDNEKLNTSAAFQPLMMRAANLMCVSIWLQSVLSFLTLKQLFFSHGQ